MATAAAARKHHADDAAEISPQAPQDFAFDVETSLPIPEVQRKGPVDAHPFIAKWATMSHNDSMFIPAAYWFARGHAPEKATLKWQKSTLGNLFTNFKAKDKEHRAPLRLVTVVREVGEDATRPGEAGVRCWLVDNSR